ncbi:phospho-acceptor domain-containing protein [Promicromonospora sp. AC04]|uniref:sensor histidine kinase n=1 Tax=Promicromonospora sp. AC04 TaxID=2135723 RepID=UPI000D3DAC74|nr:HAMP domain-containing sensor histidine kinase [Promicromonospora sp. AC04]PUB26136.1 phospho-acceptor domain-containing protein [Promicromonospora sp. AC04]
MSPPRPHPAARRLRARTNSGPAETTGSPPDGLIGMVGHDLRSPLTSVLGYAQLLGADSLTAEQQGYVAVIERNGRRLLRLINELVLGAHLAAGELTITRREADLARVARTCGDELGPTARAAGLSLTVAAPEKVAVSGDPELLAQVVTSLLDNAIRLTPRGGAVTVGVGPVDETTREAVIEVVDTGAGLGPDALGRLAKRPYRARGFAGWQVREIGFGLPLAQAIVDAHGGTLGVESTLGEGTRVTVTVPAGSSADLSAGAGSTPR